MELSWLPLPVIQHIFSYLNYEDICRIGNVYLELSEFAIFLVKKQIHLIHLKVEDLLRNDVRKLKYASDRINCLQFFNKLFSIQTYVDYALAFIEHGIQNEDVSLELGKLADCLSNYIVKVFIPVI